MEYPDYYCPNCEKRDDNRIILLKNHPDGGHLTYICPRGLEQYSLEKLKELKATPVEPKIC